MDEFFTRVPEGAGYEIEHAFVTNGLAALGFETFELGVTLDFPDAQEPTKALRLVLVGQTVQETARRLREFADQLEAQERSSPPAMRQ